MMQFKVLDVPHILYEEDCWININKRLMQLKSRPIVSQLQNYAVMEEFSTFSPFSSNPDWYIQHLKENLLGQMTTRSNGFGIVRTLFKQEGTIEMIGFGRMSWILEMFVSKFLTRGARHNAQLMEELIQERLAAFRANLY